MINILIIIIMGIAIAGGGVFAAVSFLTASQNAGDAYINTIRLEETAAAIQSNFLYVQGAIRSPAGDNTGAYSQVPTWITHNAKTVNGVPFEYCPYAPAGWPGSGASSTAKLPNSGSYAMTTVSTTDTGSHSYVVASDTPPADGLALTLGILVMPAPNSRTMPSCANVTSSGGADRVAGGVALSITPANLPTRFVPASPGALNIYAAPTASGTASGRDAADPMTFANAMQMWDDLRPRVMIINLAAGTYSSITAPTIASIDLDNPTKRKLVWRGAVGAMPTTIINLASGFSVAADWSLENLTLTPSLNPLIKINTGTVASMNNVTGRVYSIDIYGTLNINGPTTLHSYGSGFNIYPGGQWNVWDTLTIDKPLGSNMALNILGAFNVNANVSYDGSNGNAGYDYISIKSGGVLRMNGSTFAFKPYNPNYEQMDINSGARLELLNGATLDFSSITTAHGYSSIYVYGGSIFADNSFIRFFNQSPVGVDLWYGGELFLTNGAELGGNTLSQRPKIGVRVIGYGSSRIGGDSTYFREASYNTSQGKIYALNQCWQDYNSNSVLIDSDEGATKTSAPRNGSSYRYLVIDNRTNWLCTR